MEIKKTWSGYQYGFITQPRIKRSCAFLSTSTIKERVKGLTALSGINRQLIEKCTLKSWHLSEKSNLPFLPPPHCPVHVSLLLQEFRQKVMLGTPFVVIWLVGFIADLDIDSWLIKGVMYAGVWVAVQFLSKYVSITTVQRLLKRLLHHI